MDSDQIIDGMAEDFSMILGEVLELEDASIDEFRDPVTEVFGDAPTEASVISVYRSDQGATKLADELNEWLETDAVTPKLAKQLMEVAITNNFGPDALK